MFQFFWRVFVVPSPRADPLDHPQLQDMSPNELADLPLTPEWPYGHFTSGGIEERIESTLPPVLRPKIVPRS